MITSPCRIGLIAVLGVLAISHASPAGYVRSVAEVMDFSNGYVMADGSIYAGADADLVNSAVSGAWTSFSKEFAVLRFYALFNHPDDRMVVFGSTSQAGLELVVRSPSGRQFFEHELGGILPGNIRLAQAVPTFAFDSWFTVGAATDDEFRMGGGGILGTLPNSMADGLSLPPFPETVVWTFLRFGDGTPNPLAIPDDQGRVLYAQITVPLDTRFGFSGSIGLFPEGGSGEIRRTFSFNAVPAPGAFGLMAMAFMVGATRRRRR